MNIYDLTTPGEIISYGAVITIEGMIVVFLILILIMVTIYGMGLFSGDKKKNKKASAPVTEVVEEIPADTVNEEELIAVLTAAVAACMGTSSASVNIRSYKKVSPAWGNAAKREALDNRF